MAEAKKAVARIQLPPKAPRPVEADERRDEVQHQEPDTTGVRGVRMLMSKANPPKRDSLIVPLVGLLFAFSVISLIVQMLIAFS